MALAVKEILADAEIVQPSRRRMLARDELRRLMGTITSWPAGFAIDS